MKKVFTVFILILLIGFAAGFESEVHVIDDVSSNDDAAEFKVEVENTGSSADSYRMHIHDYHRSRWYQYDNSISLDPGEKGNMSITVTPGDDAVGQTYAFDVSVRQGSTDEVQRHQERFRVVRENDLNVVDIQKSDIYRPGEEMAMDVVFRNVDSSTTEYKDVVFKALGVNKTIELGPIVPGGERRISTEFEIPQFESPGQKQIAIEFDERTYTDSFEVEEVKNITEQTSRENRFLVVNSKSIISNNGNVAQNYTYSVEKSSYVSPVVYAPRAETEELDGSVNYTWSMNIQPGETAEVELRTDYWIPVTGLALLLVGFLTLKKITSSVSTRKTVTKTGKGLDIKIEVANNSSKTFDDVVLEDFIPNIAELESSFEMASPEVKHTDHGSELKWWINELQPGDQRIFKYSIRPKIEVEEGMTLKSAVLKDGEDVLDKTRDIDTEFRPSE